jgi:hypothetical protein
MNYLEEEAFDLFDWYNDQIPTITKYWVVGSDKK